MRDETATAPFERVGVVGGGAMGGGIAELCARAGIDVLVVEPDDGAWGRLCARLAASIGSGPVVAMTSTLRSTRSRAISAISSGFRGTSQST